jgi:hypothetical protein
MMSQTFTCPACGAPQDPPIQPGQTSVTCPYCGHTVIVPTELRIPLPPPPEPKADVPVEAIVSVATAIPAAASSLNKTFRTALSCVVISAILLAIATIALVPLVSQFGTKTESETIVTVPPLTITLPAFPTRQVEPTQAGLATLGLAIGQEGIGPGQFMDLRHVAVDDNGNIYTGQHDGGRIQVFDQDGNFITQWQIDDELPLVSMTASRDGTVYIVMGGQLALYDGLTGEFLGGRFHTGGFDDAFATLDGGLLTAQGGTGDNLLRFNAEQNQVLSIPQAISSQTGDSELKMMVAEDGEGKIYALGSFNDGLFIFDDQGKFLNRIGSMGDAPGQFRAVQDVVVDGQGRIYVSDFGGVQVFWPDGRFIGRIETDTTAFGLAVDDQDNLYVAGRTRLYRYRIP